MSDSAARCAHCGEPVQYNAYSRGYSKARGAYKQPLSKPGWAHSDSMRRDHAAAPHDSRSPEVDLERKERLYTKADEQVTRTLGRQFEALDVERKVNEVFGA